MMWHAKSAANLSGRLCLASVLGASYQWQGRRRG
jgi:hypothetical protein